MDPTNIAALAGLAKCYVATGAIEQAKQTLAMVRNRSATTPRSRPCRRRSTSPNRPRRLARSASWNKKWRPIRSIIRRDSTWRPRLISQASALKPPISCSRSSSATANGTTMPRESNSCSSSTPGAVRSGHHGWTQAAIDDLVLVARIPRERYRSCDESTRQADILKASTGAADADQCRISRARRPSRGDTGVSAARRATAAARPDAAQHLRAAVSRNGGRCAARWPSADRHDPAGRFHSRDEERPETFRVGCVGRITQLAEAGDGRYILEAHGHRALQGDRGDCRADRIPAMQGGSIFPTSTISRRAKARRPSTARRCSRC